MIQSQHLAALSAEQQHLVRRSAAHLEREFDGTFGRETIERFIADSLDQLVPTATVTTFLPLLTERFARERLRALAVIQVRGIQGHGADRPGVLFLCVHNAGRSQMAAGWLRHLAGDGVTVWSGGSEPASAVNPAAVEVMAEVGIDITAEFPKPWSDEVVRAADVVITMGCGDACPLYPGKRYEDWELSDPAGRDVDDVRLIRDEIRRRVEVLLDSLASTAGAVDGAR
jgi:protein-tyrosine-phosphatase